MFINAWHSLDRALVQFVPPRHTQTGNKARNPQLSHQFQLHANQLMPPPPQLL